MKTNLIIGLVRLSLSVRFDVRTDISLKVDRLRQLCFFCFIRRRRLLLSSVDSMYRHEHIDKIHRRSLSA